MYEYQEVRVEATNIHRHTTGTALGFTDGHVFTSDYATRNSFP